jgi:fatty acid desaturase
MTTWKDYSLSGLEGQRKVEAGLASARWYACPVPRKIMKELMQRYWNMNYRLEHHLFPMVPITHCPSSTKR